MECGCVKESATLNSRCSNCVCVCVCVCGSFIWGLTDGRDVKMAEPQWKTLIDRGDVEALRRLEFDVNEKWVRFVIV